MPEHVEIVSLGNPIELKTKLRYKIKAVGKEQVIESQVLVHTTGEGDAQKITKVEDKWNGDVPADGFFAKVSLFYICLIIAGHADQINPGHEEFEQR